VSHLQTNIKIVSRGSHLAVIQAKKVGDKIKSVSPETSIEYHTTKTRADLDSTINISEAGEVGLFTKDISKNIINRKYDLAIHSWKDLPVEPSEQTEVIGTLSRGDMRDVVIIKPELINVKSKDCLEILTSSPRRKYNLENILSDLIPLCYDSLRFIDIRGNIETRLNKFISGNSDMIIMAKVAIDRIIESGNESSKNFMRNIMNKNKWIILPLSIFPTAPGQGAIAIEAKKDRTDLKEIMRRINSESTFNAVQKEKSILSSYGGGCHQKIGASVWEAKEIVIDALVGKTEEGLSIQTLSTNQLNTTSKMINVSSESMYPLKDDKKIFKRNNINNIQKIESLQKSLIYLSRKNVLNNCGNIHTSNILWTSGIQCWKYAVKKGNWINGTDDSFGEASGVNIENFISPDVKFYKLSHNQAMSKSFTLIPTYELLLNKKRIQSLSLSKKTHFFWMSPLQFDIAIEYFPEIINKDHSCGFGKTYEHLKTILPNQNKIKCFLSYKHWRVFYQKEKI